MEIRINGKTVDITPDHEKTVGEIITGLDSWLTGYGHRLSGLAIDGDDVDIASMESAFSREIDSVKIIDLFTHSLAELFVMTLIDLLGDVEKYKTLNFEDKNKFYESWKEKACAKFIAEQIPDLYLLYANTFCEKGIEINALHSITEERLREVKEPIKELADMQSRIEEIRTRLVDLPLDIQTGKDRRAAETIQIFTGATEKIFRIIRQLDMQGLMQNTEEGKTVQMIMDFNRAVRELLQAYEKQDTVLVGDLAEYEIAPKLGELYGAVMESKKGDETQ